MIPIWEDSQDNIFMEKESWMYSKILARKFLDKHLKKLQKLLQQKAITTAAPKTGEHVGKKAGDKIIQMLSKSKKPNKVTFDVPITQGKKAGDEISKILSDSKQIPKPMSQQDRYQQLGLILSDD